jgi:aldose 1-epimerase
VTDHPIRPTSGTQYEIEGGGYRAVVASVGASLRLLTHWGRDLVVPFAADELRPAYRGATLAPWPNRIVDGRWRLRGETLQLPLTEPSRGHALHGLTPWLDFTAISQGPSHVTLLGLVEPQAGYPFRLMVKVSFTVDDGGLVTRVVGGNLSTVPAPFGTAPHPYLVAGPSPLDTWTLTLPAARVARVTSDRLLPAGIADVAVEQGGAFDFRSGRVIGATQIDHAFTAIVHDADGVATATATDPAGGGVRMSWDAACPWVQIHTADLPAPAPNRLGLAVEPMTCPPDAFNSGEDVVWLEPSASAGAAWTIAAI